MNNTLNSENQKGSAAVKYLFSKTSMVTLCFAMLTFTVLVLLRTLTSAIGTYKLDELQSLYYIAGGSDIAVGIINALMGLIAGAITGLGVAGVFFAAESTREKFNPLENNPKTLKGVKLMTNSLILAIIFTSVMIVVSLASVSVLNYEHLRAGSSKSYYIGSNGNADSLFFLTILFGAISLTLEIALTRLILAFKRNLTIGSMSKNGSVLALITASFGSASSVVIFFVMLFQLVMPDYQNNEVTLSADTLAMNTLNVLLSAALSVIFITLIVLITVYLGCLESYRKTNQTNSVYNSLFSKNSPSPYQSYATRQNYNYNQPDNYPPYYDANRAYNSVYQNIYHNTPAQPNQPIQPKQPQPDVQSKQPDVQQHQQPQPDVQPVQPIQSEQTVQAQQKPDIPKTEYPASNSSAETSKTNYGDGYEDISSTSED